MGRVDPFGYSGRRLRGIKTVEYRSRPTRIVGERFWIYASKGKSSVASGQLPVMAWSDDLRVATPPPPLWIIELAEQVKLIEPGALLPTGVIVGSAVIADVIPPDRADGEGPADGSPADGSPADGNRGLFRWQLADVRRIKTPRKPTGHPQPVWFKPF